MPLKTFTAGETLTAADVNTYLAKQAVIVCTSGTRPASPVEGMVIHETDTDKTLFYNGASWQGIKPGAASATIATSETTASTAYVDLATVGPAAPVVTGASALVIVTAKLGATATNPDTCYVGFAVSGATTVAPGDAQALTFGNSVIGVLFQGSALFVVTGLTPGSNTFTLKYRQNGASTGTYLNRTIAVIPL